MNQGKRIREEPSSDTDLSSSKKLQLMKTSSDESDSSEKQTSTEMQIENSGDTMTSSSGNELKDYFSLMPDEVILYIFKELANYTVNKYCSPVCKRWRKLSVDSGLWDELNLAGLKIDFASLMRLISRGVKTLYLNYTTVSSSSSKLSNDEMKNVSQLRYVDLSYAMVEADGINELIKMCFNLEELNLEYVDKGIDYSTYKYIAQNKNLKALNMTGVNHVNVDGLISIFAKCSKLEYIDLSDTTLNVKSLHMISSNFPSSLKILSLNGQDELRDNHVKLIIEKCPNLEKFNISRCKRLSNIVTQYILSGLPKIKTVDICFNTFEASNELKKLCICDENDYKDYHVFV